MKKEVDMFLKIRKGVLLPFSYKFCIYIYTYVTFKTLNNKKKIRKS